MVSVLPSGSQMVQITPLLLALVAAAQAVPNAATVGTNALAGRQSGGIGNDPSFWPSQCRSICQVIITMQNCDGDLSCLCTSSMGSQLNSCLNCFSSADPSVKDTAQSILEDYQDECSSGSSGSSGGSSGSSGGSSGSSGGSSGSSGGSSQNGGSGGGNPFGGKGGATGLKAAFGMAVGLAFSVVCSLFIL
ncbi:hypothetical protein BV22DRAFT_1132365 [Leucogyrophana mollusca]|uniref:Uncharacterized protein n=1 Tax=Leucogyrophana mollusca TaxID=85980 RepID=A0ACB8B774_9AGAM|nr:hypothetical protein BV22DRAFT_1132365 [Leucogyrophana mollusca]